MGDGKGGYFKRKTEVLGEKINLVLVIISRPHKHTQNYGFIILAYSNMFQLEDSHEASIKNLLQVRKIQIPNIATAPESSQFCMAHIFNCTNCSFVGNLVNSKSCFVNYYTKPFYD
jgi:hypothetical protein